MARPDWTALAADHAKSIRAFTAAAEAVPEVRWEQPLGEGQWKPSQVAEHLRLAYEVVGRELGGSLGLRVRTPWWVRVYVRLRYLPSILRSGRLPGKQRAPHEIKPGDGPFPRAATLASLANLAATTEATLATRRAERRPGLSHHIFGQLPPTESLRFLTVHNQHHTRQIGG